MYVYELLKTCNREKVIDFFIMEQYPDSPISKKNKNILYQSINSLIDELRELQPQNNDTCILCCIPVADYMDEFIYHDIFYIKKEDVLKDFDSIEGYAFELNPWSEVLGYKISESALLDYNFDELLAYILNEITFFGWTESEQSQNAGEIIQGLEKDVRDIENGTAELTDAKDLFSLDIDLEEKKNCAQKIKKEVDNYKKEFSKCIIQERKIMSL